MRILVLISGSGSNLQALIDAGAQLPDQEFVGVISDQAGVYGLERARQAGLPTCTLPAKPGESRQSYDRRLACAIAEFKPGLIVLAGFMRILSASLVEQYRGRMLNIHPSLLPKYPGLNTHQRALDNQDSRHGCSVHFVTAQLDAGPVIIQATCPVRSTDNADLLRERVQALEHIIYPLALRWFCQRRLALHPQGAYLDGRQLPASGFCYPDHMEL